MGSVPAETTLTLADTEPMRDECAGDFAGRQGVAVGVGVGSGESSGEVCSPVVGGVGRGEVPSPGVPSPVLGGVGVAGATVGTSVGTTVGALVAGAGATVRVGVGVAGPPGGAQPASAAIRPRVSSDVIKSRLTEPPGSCSG